jgi:methylenetetrahydrofolate reductase (NADPH)
MAGTATSPTPADASVYGLLAHSRYEVLPLDGIEEQVLADVPRDVTLTVTVSPTRGLEPTLALTARLLGHGYAVVPHLRPGCREPWHLADLVSRLGDGRSTSSSGR